MSTLPAAERRRARQRAEARRTILDACESLLVEVGREGFSIRQLVSRCGYSAPTIYHHFGDKTGLIDALLEERLLHGLVAALRAVPGHEDALDDALARYQAFARWAVEHAGEYRLLMEHRGDDAEPLPSSDEAIALLQSPFETLVDVGRLAAEDLDAIGQASWGCLHGLISLPLLRPDIDWQPDLIERSLDAVIRGWLGETGRPASPTPEATAEKRTPSAIGSSRAATSLRDTATSTHTRGPGASGTTRITKKAAAGGPEGTR